MERVDGDVAARPKVFIWITAAWTRILFHLLLGRHQYSDSRACSPDKSAQCQLAAPRRHLFPLILLTPHPDLP